MSATVYLSLIDDRLCISAYRQEAPENQDGAETFPIKLTGFRSVSTQATVLANVLRVAGVNVVFD